MTLLRAKKMRAVAIWMLRVVAQGTLRRVASGASVGRLINSHADVALAVADIAALVNRLFEAQLAYCFTFSGRAEFLLERSDVPT
jgi:hypothetical protein